MVIINKYTNKSTACILYMVHYFQHGRLMRSSEKLKENIFHDFKKQLLKGHKEVFLFNVVSVQALKATSIEDIDQI